ncbi:nucleotidyltransferase family protein [Mesorhizobium sp. 10J20-29]
MSKAVDDLVARARPNDRVWLLLHVILGDDNVAAEAWHSWWSTGPSPEPSLAEQRLLPSVSQRLSLLEIVGGLPPLVSVARRNTYLINQARLKAVRPLLEQILPAMPVMILKGGARIAVDAQAMHLRSVRDLDLLLPQDHLSEALEIAIANGYRSVSGLLPGPVKSRALAPLFEAGSRRHDYMELDFHAVPLRFGRLGNHDDGLWRRAIDAKLAGLPVKVPSVTDRLLHAVAHGLVADNDKPADWLVDSVIALRDPSFDVAIATEEIAARRLGLPMKIATSLLDELGVAVPRPIVDACGRDLRGLLFRHEMAASLKPGNRQTLMDRVLLNGAEWRRSFGSRQRIVSWKTAWLAKPSVKHPGSGWNCFVEGRANLSIEAPKDNCLVLRFACPDTSLEGSSFDVLLDGVWIGRARFRLTHLLAPWPVPSWQVRMSYRLPQGRKVQSRALLTIVALDRKKAPTASAPGSLRVSVEMTRRSQTPLRSRYPRR